MEAEKLQEIIGSHRRWLKNEEGGLKANLLGADMSRANLCGVVLPEQIIQVGPIGSHHDYTTYWAERDIVQCGCWDDYKGQFRGIQEAY